MPSNNILRLRITIYPGMNNNNNNQTPIMQMRDRLFQVLFMRVSIAYASIFPRIVRKILEHLILLFAVCSLFLLAYSHVMFIQAPMNCLDSLTDNWPRQGILRVEIINKARNASYTLKDSYLKEAKIRQMQGYNLPHFNREDFVTKQDVDSVGETQSEAVILPPDLTEVKDPKVETLSERTVSDEDVTSFLDKTEPSPIISTMYRNPNHTSIADGDSLSKTWYVFKALKDDDFYEVKEVDFYEDAYIIEYSLEYGYLRLSPKARERLNIPVKLAALDPALDACFGSWLAKLLMENFLGYDNILMASIRKLAEKEENKGYIRNVVSDNYFRFVQIMNHLSYAYAAIIMLIFTLSISMLLRYSHHQIFVFIVQILRLFEFRGSTSVPAAPLLTVILALVGMEAIMSEFFSDPTTSFYVILIVWIADQYDAICCRTVVAKRHWLRFFYLYHYAFYAYDYRFSGQYSDLALFTSCCFIAHSMIYFFHHYELPAILHAVHRESQPQQNQSEPEPVPHGQDDIRPTPTEEPPPIPEQPEGVPEVVSTNVDEDPSPSSDHDDTDSRESRSSVQAESVNAKLTQRDPSKDDTKPVEKTIQDIHSVDYTECKADDNASVDPTRVPLKNTEITLNKYRGLFSGEDAESFTSSSSSSILCQNDIAQGSPCPKSTARNKPLVTCSDDAPDL